MPQGRIYLKSKEEFAEIIKNSKTYNGVLKHYGITNGGFIQTIRNRIEKEKHDISHFNKNWYNHRTNLKWTLETILVENSKYKCGTNIKKKLYAAGLKKEECEECNLGTDWNGKKIVLQLDHINGNHTDNRIENLRIICPNCHSQTDTFCSKNGISIQNKCIDCDTNIKNSSKRCADCSYNRRRTQSEEKHSTYSKVCIDCDKKVNLETKRCKSCDTMFRNLNKLKITETTHKNRCMDCDTNIKNSSKRCITCYKKSVTRKNSCEDCGGRVSAKTVKKCHDCSINCRGNK